MLTKPFLPFVTFGLYTEPVMMDIQILDKFELAEKKGFEPLLGMHPLAVFETAPFDHLGTSP